VGALAAHKAVLRNYGGDAAGAAGAYGNMARSATQAIKPSAAATGAVKTAGADALDLIKKKLSAVKPFLSKIGFQASKKLLTEFDIPVEDLLRKPDRAGLADRKVTSFDMPECAPHEKRHPVVKTAAAGALATAGLATLNPNVRAMLAGAAKAIKARRYAAA
jgi:hypothetical protein